MVHSNCGEASVSLAGSLATRDLRYPGQRAQPKSAGCNDACNEPCSMDKTPASLAPRPTPLTAWSYRPCSSA